MKGTPHSVDRRDGGVQVCNEDDSAYEVTFETPDELAAFIAELVAAGKSAFGTPSVPDGLWHYDDQGRAVRRVWRWRV